MLSRLKIMFCFQNKLLHHVPFNRSATMLQQVYCQGYFPAQVTLFATGLRSLTFTSSVATPHIQVSNLIEILCGNPTIEDLNMHDGLSVDSPPQPNAPPSPSRTVIALLPRLRSFMIFVTSLTPIVQLLRRMECPVLSIFQIIIKRRYMTADDFQQLCQASAIQPVVNSLQSMYIDLDCSSEMIFVETSSSLCPHHGKHQVFLAFQPNDPLWANQFLLCFLRLELIAIGPLGRYMLLSSGATRPPYITWPSLYRFSRFHGIGPTGGTLYHNSILQAPFT